ncbi:MAG: citrate lyase holo-[Selenomonadaceae bacterium]|nr:citrate lyase holo-[acyl-carrier protein] synthase [Selenomonadaceae bacterium]
MLKGLSVELPAMLVWRESRVSLQRELMERHHSPLLSFSLNIPGPVKTNAELLRLFEEGLASITSVLQSLGIGVLEKRERHAATGDECLMALQGDAILAKENMTALEERHPLGRLFDIDILDADGQKLSRPFPRRCLICDEQAQACARSRRHSVEELVKKIEEMLQQHETTVVP